MLISENLILFYFQHYFRHNKPYSQQLVLSFKNCKYKTISENFYYMLINNWSVAINSLIKKR